MANCLRKISDASKASPDIKPERFVYFIVENMTDQFDPRFNDRKEYRQFVFVGCASNPVPVKILRDTRAPKILVLGHTMDFDKYSNTCEFVICPGIQGRFISVLMHRVYLVLGSAVGCE